MTPQLIGPIASGTIGASSTSMGAWFEITPAGGFPIPLDGFFLQIVQESAGYGVYFQIGIGATPLNITTNFLYFQNQGYIQNKILIPIFVPAGTSVSIRGFSGTGSPQSTIAQMFGLPAGSPSVIRKCSLLDGFFNGNYTGLPGFPLSNSLQLITTTRSDLVARNIITGTEVSSAPGTNYNVNIYAGSSVSDAVLLDSILQWGNVNGYMQNNSQIWVDIPPGTNIYSDISISSTYVNAWFNIFY